MSGLRAGTDRTAGVNSETELSRLQRLVADLDAVVWEAEADTCLFSFVGGSVRRILGYDPEDWLADPGFWATHIHPEYCDDVVQEFVRAVGRGEAHDLEYRFLAGGDRVVWLRQLGHVTRDSKGKPEVVRGLMVDVTDQKLALEGEAEAEARYQALVEQLPAITYTEAIVDDEISMLYVSPRVEETLGISPNEWVADRSVWAETIHPDDRERVLEENRRVEQTGGPFVLEYRMIARDGRVRWFHDEALLVRDDEGRPRYWRGLMLDITEAREAEQLGRALETERETAARLRHEGELMNTFLMAVSHDLRTPLAAILGLAATLEREDLEFDAAEARDFAGRIAANANKLDRLVTDLLDMDRIGRGILEPNLEEIDVGALVRELVEAADLTGGRQVAVQIEPVIAAVDRSKVERIVENLLSNAGRHTPPDARVWVRVRAHDEGALILVEDNGPGVPPEFRERIFEAFRPGPDQSEGSPGVGLGLTLVARFAELHEGRAWVQGRRGGGASFRVFLPRRPPSRASKG